MAVVVVLLGEQLLPTPEIRGSNPKVGNHKLNVNICQSQPRKDENKKRVRERPV